MHASSFETVSGAAPSIGRPANAGAAPQTARWLIPELLPEVQPAAFSDYRAAGVRRLRFSYPDALPPGLLPRFIVRTHELSAGQARWRSGVVLAWGRATALVRLDRHERRTTVEVLGTTQEDVQGLCDTIRAHLAVLHGKLRVVEEVQVSEEPAEWVKMEELRMAELEQDAVLKVTIGQKPNTRRLELPVRRTLDAVESREARVAEGPTPPRRMRLFVSYAHDDKRQIKTLSTHLTILGQRGYIQPWDDTQLIAGEKWEERIMKELAEADLVLVIISDQSRASTFIRDKELPTALARMDAGQCRVIPVPLDGATLDKSDPLEEQLRELMMATWNARPVLRFARHADGWREVGDSVRKAVVSLRGEALR